MCFEKLFAGLFGGPQKVQVVSPAVNMPAPTPPAAPAPSADPPSPDNKKSSEMESARADKSGFNALIIPRTAFPAVSRSVPGAS